MPQRLPHTALSVLATQDFARRSGLGRAAAARESEPRTLNQTTLGGELIGSSNSLVFRALSVLPGKLLSLARSSGYLEGARA